MMISLLSSLLLIGSAAPEGKIKYGRSVHKRSSPLKRIRRAERNASLATEEVTTIKAPRILTEDDVQKKPTAEIATVEIPQIAIILFENRGQQHRRLRLQRTYHAFCVRGRRMCSRHCLARWRVLPLEQAQGNDSP